MTALSAWLRLWESGCFNMTSTMIFNEVLYIIGFFVVLLALLWLIRTEDQLDEKEKAKEAELDRMERARRHRAIREAMYQQKLDRLNPYLFDDTQEREAK